MHDLAMQLVNGALERFEAIEALALDVGSLDINGTLKECAKHRGWRYMGIDLHPGPGVDIVVNDFRYPFADDTFDVVMSACTMEHVTAIWRWVPELVRVLKKGGLLIIETHTMWGEHRFPFDCWRVLPDGMRFLFDETGQLGRYQIKVRETDIVGSAFKAH